jgi:UDP:flavonoid glycosyltransferase YjiC (YdhE family)
VLLQVNGKIAFMAHIVCVTSGLTGIFHASLEVISRLDAQGHEVTYLSTPSRVNRLIEEGIQVNEIPPINISPGPERAQFTGGLTKFKKIWSSIKSVKERRSKAVHALGMNKFAELLKSVNPDLVLIDMELHEHVMTIFQMDIPLILMSPWFSGWKSSGLPPLGTNIIPGRGAWGSKFGIELAWFKYRIIRFLRINKSKTFQFFTDRHSVLKKYSKQVGFPKNELQKYHWPPPFTYKSIPVISLTAKELEFPHNHRANLNYVGPMVYTKRLDTRTHPEDMLKLEKLFVTKQKLQKTLIYCSLSSMTQGDLHFAEKLIKAVSNQSGWMLILGLGGLIDANTFGILPENVYAFHWVPQLEVLKYADCSINHGGIHTINECIHFKVPMIVYSGKKFDQNGCAARIMYHGLGIMSDKDVDNPEQIQKHIHTILSNNAFSEKIDQMNQACKKYKIKGELERIIQKHLSQ